MKTLTLKKETLHKLEDQELVHLAGGLSELCQISTACVTPLCNNTTKFDLTNVCITRTVGYCDTGSSVETILTR